MNLTKEQALTYTVEMWGWLAKNGGKTKVDFFREFPEHPSRTHVAHCSLCHFVDAITGDCEQCPLMYFWAANKTDPDYAAVCTNSVFGEWEEAVENEWPNLAAKHAARIAEAARKELENV